MIDSAQAYDEEQVGAAVQESGIPREDIFIVSKVHPRFLGHDETLKSVEETLTKLKVVLPQLIFAFIWGPLIMSEIHVHVAACHLLESSEVSFANTK